MFVLLMALSLFASLLPPRYLAPLRNLHQPLSLLHQPMAALTRGVSGQLVRDGATISAEEAEGLKREIAELRRLVDYLEQQRRATEQQLAEVAAIRAALLGEDASIVIARVLRHASTPRRAALILDRGSMARVREGLWVVAGRPPRPQEELSGRAALGRQWLIGRISEVRTYESTVRLATDPGFRCEVRVARAGAGGGWDVLDVPLSLRGIGDGQMLIPEATRDFYAEQARTVLVPEGIGLPSTMPIGRVAGSERIDATQLHYDLTVQPLADPGELVRAYVIVPG